MGLAGRRGVNGKQTHDRGTGKKRKKNVVRKPTKKGIGPLSLRRKGRRGTDQRVLNMP